MQVIDFEQLGLVIVESLVGLYRAQDVHNRNGQPINGRGERASFGCPKVLERLPELTAQLPG